MQRADVRSNTGVNSTMINEDAGRAIGDIIVREVSRLPPLLAVAIGYETAQSGPAMYLAYETAEHCMQRLKASATNAAATELEARLSRFTGADEHFAITDRLGRNIGNIFNTGNWINPASPVLLDIDSPNPIVETWANRAFEAILIAIRGPEDTIKAAHAAAEAEIRGTFWFAIDYARQHATGKWPPISFVQSFDDYSQDLITTITTRTYV
jgi:hypothetical protein